MPKTGLKTFVYSFSVSLFAIFAANGVYWHEHKRPSQEPKISDKNIMLFLKSEQANPSKTAAPVKKIALNVLPDLKPTPDDDIIMADIGLEESEILEIPLEIELPPAKPVRKAPQPPMMLAEDKVSEPLKIAEQPKSKVEAVVIPLQAPEIADISQPVAVKAPKTATEPKSAAPTSQPLLMAAADEPIPLLPIEKSSDELAQSVTKVKIGSVGDLNQVALADKSIPVHSMIKDEPEESTTESAKPQAKWQSMADKTAAESPWVVAKADGALKNGRLADEAYYQKENAEIQSALNPQQQSGNEVKIASETVKNLLIPIPEDILNDENLTPQLSYSPQNKPEPEEKQLTEVKPAELKLDSEESRKNKLLSSLNSIFSSSPKPKESKSATEAPNLLSEIRKKFQKPSAVGKIMPTEMRLSFQPNRAEISGQTLRWIQAFAARAADNQNMTIEIRIDGTTAMDLQQKRLNLLHNILTDKGVEYSKINTVFTQREPNSFIIKTITHNPIAQRRSNENINRAANGYYQQW